jgi:hypothetical protein
MNKAPDRCLVPARAWLAVIALSCTCRPVSAEQPRLCSPKPLPIAPATPDESAVYRARFGHYELSSDFGEEVTDPDAYPEGFVLRDLRKKTTCKADQGITTRVFISQDQTHLLFFSYSGSMSSFSMVRVDRCRSEAKLTAYTPKATIADNLLKVEPGCECEDDTKAKCQCDPGGVFDLGTDCVFRRLKDASLQQARKSLGVGIESESRLAYPGTARAKFLGESKARRSL